MENDDSFIPLITPCTPEELDLRVQSALGCIFSYAQIDGGHHKMWVLDQVLRKLTGPDYDRLVKESCNGEDGPETYGWDEGIAP